MNKPVRLKDCLLAAAIGDICGSPWEFAPNKELTLEGLRDCMTFDYRRSVVLAEDFASTPLFENAGCKLPHYPMATDDSICTFAIAEAVINNLDIADNLVRRCRQENMRGYGGMFRRWIWAMNSERKPYGSFGNGSAMRCSIAGWYPDSLDEAKDLAKQTAAPTHNHPEGIKGAEVSAVATFMGRCGQSKEEICEYMISQYPDWKDKTFADVQPSYQFDVTCQGSVPMVAVCLRESESFEDCILKCIQTGGDSDTLGAIAGPIAYAVYRDAPNYMFDLAERYLPQWCLDVNRQFNERFGL